jgi:hypothetical protein
VDARAIDLDEPAGSARSTRRATCAVNSTRLAISSARVATTMRTIVAPLM